MMRKRPVYDYKLLALEGSVSFETKRPAFVDAIDILRCNGWPLADHSADVNVLSAKLSSGKMAYFVTVIAPFPNRPNVHLPVCEAISGSDTLGNRTTHQPELFYGAQLDQDGNVTLKNGGFLHSCEVVPTILAPEWTREKHDVVFQLILFLGAEEQCLKQLVILPDLDWAGFLPFRAPDGRFFTIDYIAVRTLNLYAFKLDAFWQFHKSKTKEKQHLSRQTIANILRHAGIRIPEAEHNS